MILLINNYSSKKDLESSSTSNDKKATTKLQKIDIKDIKRITVEPGMLSEQFNNKTPRFNLINTPSKRNTTWGLSPIKSHESKDLEVKSLKLKLILLETST